MPTYTPNRFSGQMAQANALRAYTPNRFAGGPIGVQTGAMAPHLSQPIPLDPHLVQAYDEFRTDPQAKQYEQYGADLNRLWKVSPSASIFKPGYAHNQYILQRAQDIRDRLNPPAPTVDYTTVPSRYIYDAEGNEATNPEYQTWLAGRQERDNSD